MLDYPSLAAIAAVVREGSFEKAAQVMGITPSAVSQRVRGYEERLGIALVIRGQPCTATKQGRELCAHFDKVRLLEADLTTIPAGVTPHGLRPSLSIAVNADSLATWFPHAMTDFAQKTGMLVELTLEDEGHTADRLRTGDVLAVVTSDPTPVAGSKTIALGALGYVACASPAFVERHFPTGIDGNSLATAPVMQFNRKDELQGRWAKASWGVELNAPTHWIPSTQAFLDLACAGLAWGLQPETLAKPHIDAGTLIELAPEHSIKVPLFWTVSRLHAQALHVMTDAVKKAAQRHLQAAAV
ncbi:LysR family transcriptional regulator ArgP [Sphingobium sp. BYY-5]|uniref:LysR family transcriptional regulator ArgP n=1 Tax=Sphingobium sp. BYY-5 TaxID=2926400 RepID=UPI001FA78018|nr:LysR family transcriptional regulator ArgP [Sphingobium sp. BYY-5]MCI4591760.1 LysR family transcriptional regulator ArgP [Sphingobium sp. BYY-5]